MVAFRFENDLGFPEVACNDNSLGDLRFQRLLSHRDWCALPEAVRRRFAKRVGPGESVIYKGHVTLSRQNMAGRIFVQVLRVIGAPLPLDVGNEGESAIVTVTEDARGDGQVWTRQYGRASGFPQVIHSAKRFEGPTGLTEYVGWGIGMSLSLHVNDDTLLFENDRYFLQAFGRKVFLPQWLGAPDLVVGHADLGEGKFEFSLKLTHRLFGELLEQRAVFEDVKGN